MGAGQRNGERSAFRQTSDTGPNHHILTWSTFWNVCLDCHVAAVMIVHFTVEAGHAYVGMQLAQFLAQMYILSKGSRNYERCEQLYQAHCI